MANYRWMSNFLCDFASRTRTADVNHDKMVKLNLRDSELRAVSDSEGIYSL
jgi:hypothetical protein